jgi:hypothetical protein
LLSTKFFADVYKGMGAQHKGGARWLENEVKTAQNAAFFTVESFLREARLRRLARRSRH